MNLKPRMILIGCIILAVAYGAFKWLNQASVDNQLVVYSARKEHLIKPIFDLYEKETGFKVIYHTDKAGVLVEKLKQEGKHSPADILLTVDAGNLWHAANMGLLKPVKSKKLLDRIPAHLRDKDNRWFGLSLRARTIIYNPNKVDPKALSTYANLSDSKWKDRLCLRTSKKVYNQSLVATLIHSLGESTTHDVVQKWVKNLALPVFSSDTKVAQAVAKGTRCHVGIVNTYYVGRLLKKSPDLPVALFWPNQTIGGVHINVSGAGVVHSSKRVDSAVRFLEWLTQDTAQKLFADANLEFPVSESIKPHPIVQKWGPFKRSTVHLSVAGELQRQAIKLMDGAGYL